MDVCNKYCGVLSALSIVDFRVTSLCCNWSIGPASALSCRDCCANVSYRLNTASPRVRLPTCLFACFCWVFLSSGAVCVCERERGPFFSSIFFSFRFSTLFLPSQKRGVMLAFTITCHARCMCITAPKN